MKYSVVTYDLSKPEETQIKYDSGASDFWHRTIPLDIGTATRSRTVILTVSSSAPMVPCRQLEGIDAELYRRMYPPVTVTRDTVLTRTAAMPRPWYRRLLAAWWRLRRRVGYWLAGHEEDES